MLIAVVKIIIIKEFFFFFFLRTSIQLCYQKPREGEVNGTCSSTFMEQDHCILSLWHSKDKLHSTKLLWAKAESERHLNT